MTRTQHFLLALLTLALSACVASAQVTTGAPPFGSFGGGPDVINLANLNSHLATPVLHKPGRGMNFDYDLNYDSSIWYPVTSSGTTSWQNATSTTWGWTTSIPRGGHVGYSAQSQVKQCGGFNFDVLITYTNWTYYDGFGTPHPFPGSSHYYGCSSTYDGFTSTASDGSGYTISVTGSTVNSLTASDGAIINPTTGGLTLQDRNGNKITSANSSGTTSYYDTLSSTTPALTVSGSGTPTSPYLFTYTAPSGASASYTMKYTAYTVQTNFGCSGINEYGPTSNNLVSEIDLPDYNSSTNPNSRYTFTYETTPGDTHSPHYVTGRLASVTLPTGGTITYTFTGGSSGHITCADGSTAGLQRLLSDGASWSSTWNYARTAGTGSAYATRVTDPLGNDTITQFQGIYETQRDAYNGAGPTFSSVPISESTLQTPALLQELQTCYNGNTSNCTSTAITLPITQRNITTVLPNGKQREHDDFWNAYGAPTETDDYDYGAAPHGSLLKKVLATYAAFGNITAFRQTVTICNGSGSSSSCKNSGTPVSQINYNYDETAPTATSGIPQHVSVTSPRGNLTSVNTYTSSVTFLTRKSTYYDTGTVSTTTDVNNASTTYNYTAGTASCYNTFPTSINEAVSGLSTSATWNCSGGVQLTSVDENGQTTTTAYSDPYFWRPFSVTDPTGAVTNFCYGLLTSGTCTVNPNQTESTLNFNSNNSTVDTLTTLDGLGRVHVQQTRQSPTSSNFDSIETDYDALGRPNRITLPYSGIAGQTNSTIAGTTTTYDPFGRPLTVQDGGNGTTTYNYGQANDTLMTRSPAPTGEHTKVRQFEYDALQRLTSVCEVTAGTTAWPGGTCAQTTQQQGYWTKYTYDPMGNLMTVTQNAQMSGSTQSRSYAYDWMSRMTSETVPEIGASGNGTATYTYDADTTCGTSTGDLVKRIDAAGNVICSTYDALHRELTRTYPSGTYASVTPAKHFVYDSATVNGGAMGNAKAHLAEAYTTSSSCSSKCTDIGFSYTLRGETSDIYESTPNSATTYYHVAETYWANHAPYQLSGNLGLPTTITYGPDGEGRISTVSASSGQNPVAGTSYNPASLPTAINLGSGSGDADAFTYDAYTNRMTQYQFTVNGTSLTGALGWNANGTLLTQNITDGFNSADTQNCSYGYDDITRLTAANCVSAAAQTFSYDPFGNINKAGSPYTFNAFYSTSTNRITCIGGSGSNCSGGTIPTYDANGNVTSDSLHTYTWDADGHAITVDAGLSDAVNVTYDAMGRMVEQKRGSTYTQIVYSPGGQKLALMNGSTLQKAMVPLPGNAQAIYNSSGLLYYAHADLLGSVRLATTPTSRTMYFDTAYAPFGETYASAGGTNLDPAYTGQMNDTSHRQDTAGGLYDFPVREYSIQGRWPNPDPLGKAATCPKDPQSQNRYAYVRNNPITRVDPTGGQECDPLEDPFCDPCRLNPELCIGLPPIFILSGGGGVEITRPFPWPQLPPGFFGPLWFTRNTRKCLDVLNDCLKENEVTYNKLKEAQRAEFLDCLADCLSSNPPVNLELAAKLAKCVGKCDAKFAGQLLADFFGKAVADSGCFVVFRICVALSGRGLD